MELIIFTPSTQRHESYVEIKLGFFRFFCVDVSIEPKQTEDPHKQFEREYLYLGNFLENLGLFRFVTKQFCLFRLFRYRFETPKQTEIFWFWFHETNRNKPETDLVSVCFGSNRNLFLFVSRTPYPVPF